MSTSRLPTEAEWHAYAGLAEAMIRERQPELLDAFGDLRRDPVVDAILARRIVALSDQYAQVG